MQNQPSNTKKALVSVAALLAIAILFTAVTLNAKRSTSDQTTTTSSVAAASDTSATTPTTSTSSGTSSSASYKDGTYSASNDYETPGGEESIKVTVTLASGVINKVSISQDSNNRESSEYQDRFASSYQSLVVGQKISDLNLSRVSGASLTTEGFSNAIQQIMNQANA